MSPQRASKAADKNFLDRWLFKLKSPGTRRTYKSGIRKFLELVYDKNLEEREALSSAMERYVLEVRSSQRIPGDDILRLTDSDEAPKTVRAYVSGVKNFFEDSDIVPNGRESKVLRRNQPTKEALTNGRAPTKSELIKVLSHADLRMRAIILFITASGTRLEETLSVDLSDVKLDEHPARVCIRAEHAKGRMHKRETFLTDEAEAALRQWLRVRERYLEVSRKRHISRQYGKQADNRLFPYSKGFISRQWQAVAVKAGIYEKDEATGHGTITLHSLRKYTKVQLLNDRNGEFGEFLLGHSGINQVYNKMALEEMKKTYLKHQTALMTSVDGERYQKDVVETQSILADQRKALDLMDTGSKALRAKIDALEGENKKLQCDLESMKKEISSLKEEREAMRAADAVKDQLPTELLNRIEQLEKQLHSKKNL
jgi:integrase